jgi:hypothetical protein
MFAKTAAALALLFLSATAETLRLKLEPAPEFHNATGDSEGDLLYVRLVEPPTEEFCEAPTNPNVPSDVTTVCGGTFSLNLALYDGMEISFEAPEGKEIVIQSDPETNRVEFEFQAVADCDFAQGEYLEYDSGVVVTFTGSDVITFGELWNSLGASFLGAGKCESCSQCEIFAAFQIEASTAFSARASKLSWTIVYNPSIFENFVSLDYRYDTSGYCWIRTPFANSLVDAPPTPSPPATMPNGPTVSPLTTTPNGTMDTTSNGAMDGGSIVIALGGSVCLFVLLFSEGAIGMQHFKLLM